MFTIENIAGVDCIFAPMKPCNSITIHIFCKAGSYYETKEINGISHFIEHMFFKWGEKYQTPREVSLALDKIGADYNAYTSEEKVGYYVKCAPNHREKAFDVLADMLISPQFNRMEMEKEKGVVIQELKMYEDEPRDVLEQKWGKWFFWDNNYGWPVIGTEENIQNFTQEMLFDYKNKLYTKDNLFIVVAGNVLDCDGLKQKIDQAFALLPATKQIEKKAFTNYLPQEHESFFEKEIEQTHLAITARGVTCLQKEKWAAKMLSIILGGNSSSLLYQKIREELWLCYYIYSSHGAGIDFGNFGVYAGIDKERLDFGLEKIYAILDEVSKGKIDKQAFDDAKSFFDGVFQMGLETSSDVASFLGNQFLYKKEVETFEEVHQHLLEVTYEDVLALTSMLKRENLYLYYVK